MRSLGWLPTVFLSEATGAIDSYRAAFLSKAAQPGKACLFISPNYQPLLYSAYDSDQFLSLVDQSFTGDRLSLFVRRCRRVCYVRL